MGVTMNKIFLGKLVHWLVLLAMIPPSVLAGLNYFHVVQFNIFILVIVLYTVASIVMILRTTKRDELVTREAIPDDVDISVKE